MHTIFVGLGGTGTQIANTIANLYPFLQDAGLADTPFEMYILDKDTNSGIFNACKKSYDRYQDCFDLLPFKQKLDPYTFAGTAYQEMQGTLQNTDYTVMSLIGTDKDIQELATMCWSEEKRNESIRDGNNRDPSRGSLDAKVCLDRFADCSNGKPSSLYEGIENAKNEQGLSNVRIVILGGATGGMGSSLIVPLAEKLKEHFDSIRIDMVILGTYFSIPTGGKGVNDIGTSLDSYYRAADQIEELSALVTNDWRIYYVAMPCFDDICGAFNKNSANKRKSHLLELLAGLAAFDFENTKKTGGFYGTALNYDISKADSVIEWPDIPYGKELKPYVLLFMKLLSYLTRIMGSLSQQKNILKGDAYLKEYFNGKQANRTDVVESMRDILRKWLMNVKPYFDFWLEIQNETRVGRKGGKLPVVFFPENDMKTLAGMLTDAISDSSEKQAQNYMSVLPFLDQTKKESFINFVDGLKTNQKLIKEILSKKDAAASETAQALLRLMLQDIYDQGGI
ncbi:hypothetical protein ACYULU_04145 [Breznakiellaceae bacterium SP9]